MLKFVIVILIQILQVHHKDHLLDNKFDHLLQSHLIKLNKHFTLKKQINLSNIEYNN